MGIMRLDKFLADSGVGTRSEVKKKLAFGRVRVNGKVIRDGSVKDDFTEGEVMVDGEKVTYEEYVYYLLNKPQGCVSATKDKLSDTVIEMIKGVNTKGLFPVGRLDKDTEGLLLITNDGKLAHEMLSPKKHVEKCYYVLLDKPLSQADKEKIEDCIDIGEEKPCLPAKVEYAQVCSRGDCDELPQPGSTVTITITEGRFHQVKRMFAACGYEVVYLKRLTMGRLTLPRDLEPGSFIKIDKPQ